MIAADGVRIQATLGTPTYTDIESRIIAKQVSQNARLNNLERNSALASTAWIQVGTFQNSWSASTTVYYRKLNGVVYLRGIIAGGSTGTAFILPSGFRPITNSAFSVVSGATQTTVTVSAAGLVAATSGTTPILNISYPVN